MDCVDNPSTSYRIEKPTKSKNTPQHTKHETPRNTPSNTPWNTKKIRNSYFLGYFSGIFGVFFRSLAVGEFVCRAGIFGLFWGLWGFLLCSWLVGCQGLPRNIRRKRVRPLNMDAFFLGTSVEQVRTLQHVTNTWWKFQQIIKCKKYMPATCQTFF